MTVPAINWYETQLFFVIQREENTCIFSNTVQRSYSKETHGLFFKEIKQSPTDQAAFLALQKKTS